MTHPSYQEILQKLRPIFAELTVLPIDEIKPESLLVDDLDADSIVFLELTYEIETSFGVAVPEVKASEELLQMPLLDGLSSLQSRPGNTTFFELVGQELVRKLYLDGQTASDLAATVGKSLPEGVPADLLGSALTLAQFLDLVDPAAKGGAPPELLDRPIGDGEGPVRWLMGEGGRVAVLAQQTASTLATATGGRMPNNIAADMPLRALRLRDLFRFLTVETMARYVQFLVLQGPAA